MSDLKAAFRQAKEQRGSSSTSVAQVKALRAQKAAQQKQKPAAGQPSVAQAPSAPGPAPAPGKPSPAAPSSSAGGLPEDFFEPAPKRQAISSSSAPSNKPAAAPAPSTKAPDASLPEGFFADKAADAKARGVKLPDAKDKEDEFQAFQRMMDEELKAVAAKEAEEIEEEAGEREDREQFEQRLRMQRLRLLAQTKAKQSQGGAQEGMQGEGLPAEVMHAAEDALGIPGQLQGPGEQGQQQQLVLPKKKRVIDTMREIGATAQGEDSGSAGEDSVSEEELLDWRAKGV